jgi:hypothetical protein
MQSEAIVSLAKGLATARGPLACHRIPFAPGRRIGPRGVLASRPNCCNAQRCCALANSIALSATSSSVSRRCRPRETAAAQTLGVGFDKAIVAMDGQTSIRVDSRHRAPYAV